MAQRIQFRRGTAAQWAASNPVLAEGELAVELDTGKYKLGDGLTSYNSLAYSSGPTGPQGPQGDPTTVNGKTGSSITLTASDVGADAAGAAAAAQSAAIAAAATDATSKANTAKSAAIAAAATDATSKANTAKSEAITAAAADATSKASAAQSAAIAAAATDASAKADLAHDEAIAIAADDATVKADAAETAAKTYADTTFVPLSDKGVAGGVATLDTAGKVQPSQLPPLDYDTAGAAAAAQTAAETYADNAVADHLAAPDPHGDRYFASTVAAEAEAAAKTYADSLVSEAASSAEGAYVPLTQKGASSGVATLDGTGKVPANQLPALAISDTFVVTSQSAMLALTAEVGDIAVRSDLSKSFILKTAPASTPSHWQELLTPPSAVLSVDGRTGAVSLSDLYVSSSDSRLTDQRTPTDGSVTTAKIVSGAVTGTRLALGAVTDATVSSTAAISPAKLGSGGAAVGQALVWDGAKYAPATPLPSRATASVTTAALAPGATGTATISLAKGYQLLGITVSAAARVRLYTTAAAMSADASRNVDVEPAWNAGVVMDFVAAGSTSGAFSPTAPGINNESTPSASIPISVTNRSASSTAITVSFTYLPEEA